MDSQCCHISSFNAGNISRLQFVNTFIVYNRKNHTKIPNACWDSWGLFEASVAWQQMTQYVESSTYNYEGQRGDWKVELLLVW